VAVGAADGLVGSGALVGGAEGLADLTGGEELPGLPDGERDPGFEQRHVDVLALTVEVALAERGEDAHRDVHGADQVAHRHADLDRVAVRGPGDAHQAAAGLRHDVETGQRGQWAVLPPARRGGVDQPRVEHPQVVVPEAEAAHRPRSQVLDQDVGALDHPPERREAIGVLEVEPDGLLVAVEPCERRALALEEGSGGANRVSAGGGVLDLQDAGAEVGQVHRGERRRHEGAHLENDDALERAGALGLRGAGRGGRCGRHRV